jgi:uncharacterized protein YuzE
MKIAYDRKADALYIRLLEDGAQVVESDEKGPGVILDYDASGDLASLEILDASRRVTDPDRIDFETIVRPT